MYRDPNGLGDFIEMYPGSIFGEKPFRSRNVERIRRQNDEKRPETG